MGHFEAEWMRYWLDIHEGKYQRKPKSKPRLTIAEEFMRRIGTFREDLGVISRQAKPFFDSLRAMEIGR